MELKAIDLAALYCTNRAMITRATQNKKLFKNNNDLYDTEDPKNKNFLDVLLKKNKRKIESAGGLIELQSIVENKLFRMQGSDEIPIPADFDINDWTAPKLIQTFGPTRAKQIVELERSRADAIKKTQEHKMKSGELIERETVAVQLVHYLEVLNKKLLMHPSQIADRMIAVIKSKNKKSKEKFIEMFTSYISRSIQDTKKEMTKRLAQIQREQIVKLKNQESE